MTVFTDLHIHSCLSPCAHEDMTPNNIVNMALLKGLELIAVTDHNSCANCGAVMEAGKRAGLAVVPAMELCTAEEIHLLCYFPSLEAALEMQCLVYGSLLPYPNRPDIFGDQLIMDSLDVESGRENRFLAGATTLDAREACKRVRGLGGAPVPAHVDREAFSMLNTLGTLPQEYGFKFMELSRSCNVPLFLNKHADLGKMKLLRSSDAHFLWDLFEKEECMPMEAVSSAELVDLLEKSPSGML